MLVEFIFIVLNDVNFKMKENVASYIVLQVLLNEVHMMVNGNFESIDFLYLQRK